MRVLGPANPLPDLSASATAARIDEAGIGISSGVLTVTNALVNSVNDLLGALLGIELRLSAADVEALMASNVDAGLFFDALAQRVGESRSEERRVGKECVSTGRYRWWPDHEKKKEIQRQEQSIKQ